MFWSMRVVWSIHCCSCFRSFRGTVEKHVEMLSLWLHVSHLWPVLGLVTSHTKGKSLSWFKEEAVTSKKKNCRRSAWEPLLQFYLVNGIVLNRIDVVLSTQYLFSLAVISQILKKMHIITLHTNFLTKKRSIKETDI